MSLVHRKKKSKERGETTGYIECIASAQQKPSRNEIANVCVWANVFIFSSPLHPISQLKHWCRRDMEKIKYQGQDHDHGSSAIIF